MAAAFPWVVIVFIVGALALFLLRPLDRMRIRTAALLFASALHAQPPAAGANTLPFTPKGARGAYSMGGSTKEGPGETAPYKSAREEYVSELRAAYRFE